MYSISVTLSNRETKFKATGISRVRAKIISEKRNRDGSRHECHRGETCLVATTHILTAKSKNPFVVFVGDKVVVATDQGSVGARFLVRDSAGFFRDMEVSEYLANFVIF